MVILPEEGQVLSCSALGGVPLFCPFRVLPCAFP